MKSFLNILLVFYLVCCLLPVSAYAANDTYDLDELGMSIDLPEDLVVFTRDIKSNDPNLSEYGLTKDSMISLMQERNIYLNAWDENISYEITVTMVDSPFADYNQFSDTSLNSLMPTLASEYESLGITFTKSELYQHTQAKFIKIYISQPNSGDTVYGLQYNTVYDNKAINVTLQSYSGKIDSNKESLIKEIVDTIHFDTELQLLDTPAPTEAFTYTDSGSGVSFTVPANWTEEPMTEEREYIDAKFISILDPGMCMIFTSQDLWSLLTDAEKQQYSRSEADNSLFTKADVAAIYGCQESDVSMVTFSDREYFYTEVETTGSSYGFTVSIPMTYLVRCENGYMYIFQFSGTRDSEYYGDFKDLMNSVVFPQISPGGADLWSYFGPINFTGSLIITIAVYSLPIIIYRYAVLKRPVDKKKAKRITVIYGIAAFIVMSLIITLSNGNGAAGGAIFLWSWVNYRMLIGGKNRQTQVFTSARAPEVNLPGILKSDIASEAIDDAISDSDETHEELPADTSGISEIIAETDDKDSSENGSLDGEVTGYRPTIAFCHKCGNKLIPDSVFCNKCGAKIPNAPER